jgi:hypothetical protein
MHHVYADDRLAFAKAGFADRLLDDRSSEVRFHTLIIGFGHDSGQRQAASPFT